VDQQKNNKDCGIFAIAFLVALCHRFDPSCLRFDTSMKLREHLVHCYEEGSFSLTDLFPTRSAEADHEELSLPGKLFSFVSQSVSHARRRVVLRDRKIDIICRCRLPIGNGRKDRTVICSNLFCATRLYHESCIRVFDSQFYCEANWRNWICPSCRDNSFGV